jgi:predicted membrane channel-forming protein YqfA (hemolysin III family)
VISAAEERSLDLVQRVVFSAIVVVVTGGIATVLAVYVAFNTDELPRTDVVILWAMTGVIGIITTVVVLLINRRRPFSPWLLLGLLPMAASAYWVLR